MFDLLLAALPEATLAQVMDVVNNVPAVNPFSILKARLLEAHVVSDQEKMDALFHAFCLPIWPRVAFSGGHRRSFQHYPSSVFRTGDGPRPSQAHGRYHLVLGRILSKAAAGRSTFHLELFFI